MGKQHIVSPTFEHRHQPTIQFTSMHEYVLVYIRCMIDYQANSANFILITPIAEPLFYNVFAGKHLKMNSPKN